MRSPFRAVALAMLALTATGCARLHARSAVAPPLEAPPAPVHLMPPVEEARAPEPPPPVVTESPVAPPPVRPIQRPPASATRPQPAPRAEATDVGQATVPPPPETPPRTLQTTTNVEVVEKRIRTVLADATRDLSRIDYRGLNGEGKAQYDIAKRFVEQAEEALVGKNYLFASQLADKASVLATLLTR